MFLGQNLHILSQYIKLAYDFFAGTVKAFSGRSKLKAAVVAVDELHAELSFQIFNLQREGWLRNITELGCLPKIFTGNGGKEILHLT